MRIEKKEANQLFPLPKEETKTRKETHPPTHPPTLPFSCCLVWFLLVLSPTHPPSLLPREGPPLPPTQYKG